mmetsp:Transcript_13047/g.27081  ORF Transcript_13047/g.27081 Transcript_13047/m.27081 type:complete len:89 (-) Transcript_13047:150-416(-)
MVQTVWDESLDLNNQLCQKLARYDTQVNNPRVLADVARRESTVQDQIICEMLSLDRSDLRKLVRNDNYFYATLQEKIEWLEGWDGERD